MIRLFLRKKLPPGQENRATGKIAGIATSLIQRVQIRFARTLSQFESRLSVREKKWAVLIFYMALTGLSAYWIYDGFFAHMSRKQTILKHQRVAIPQNIVLPDSLDVQFLQKVHQLQEAMRPSPDSTKK